MSAEASPPSFLTSALNSDQLIQTTVMIMLKIQWYMVHHFNAEWLPSPDHLQNMYLCMYMGGEGNGKPLQYSCLENPMDGGAW